MADTSDFRNGLCIEFKDDLFTLVQFQHVKPGKGNAFVRTKLKSLTNGRVIENTFIAGDRINVARVERRPHQFLYKDDSGYHFMHNETFEQITLEEKLIENSDLYKEGQNVEIVVHADTDNPLACDLPPFIVREVTYTEPGMKGNSADNTSLKPATIETGANINVPLFIKNGEKIKIDTRDRSYVERVKE